MDSFAKLKRRTTDLVENASKNIPTMPKMPNINMPNLPYFKSDSSMKGTWQHVSIPPLPRSSHSLNVVGGSAYIFGGEVEPRKPVDNDMHVVTLPSSGAPADYYSVKAKPSSKTEPTASVAGETEAPETPPTEPKEPLTDVPLASPSQVEAEPSEPPLDKGKSLDLSSAEVPSPRVGHASAVIGTRIFLFGGRSAASETLDENGRVWVFETKTHTWSYLDPSGESTVIPPARSYFAAVATDKPRDFAIRPSKNSESWKEWAEGDSAEVGIPQKPIAGNVAANARDEEEAGFGTFIVHGGCLKDGSRANDIWAFDVRSRIWKELPTAPGKPRGGAALAIAKSRLYRFGGFDGEGEIGGQLDVLELGLELFDDRVSKGEVGVFAKGGWNTLTPPPAEAHGEKGALVAEEWPGARSVSGLHLVMGGGGREYLILLLGEQTPSGAGHEAAGNFWSDVWAFQVPPIGMTAASFKDAFLQAAGRKTGEGKWSRLTLEPYDDEVEEDAQGPGARGWFASAAMGDLEEAGVVLLGGIDEKNARLGDGWVFRLGEARAWSG
ncbi:kelch domain-containing protein [Seiridium cupressi]